MPLYVMRTLKITWALKEVGPINSVLMSGIAQKQIAFKFKIATHKQKPIVKNTLAGRWPPWPTGPCA